MPRYKKQRLDYSPTVPSLMEAALSERPFVSRTYADRERLARLRARLVAVESWANRITAALPAKLMVAASLKPHMLAGIFDELSKECSQAAPAGPDGEGLQDTCVLLAAMRRLSLMPCVKKEDIEVRADHLMHSMDLLGEYVGGNWAYFPCRTADDGTADEDGPWEREYSPPSDGVQEILKAIGLIGRKARRNNEDKEDVEVIHNRIRQLAASASDDLRRQLQGRIADVAISGLRQALGDASERLMPVHAALTACVNEIHTAVQPDADAMGSWWAEIQQRLQGALISWLDQVPKGLPLTRNKRQQLRRDLAVAFQYVSQYALLLRANQESQRLVGMIILLKNICEMLAQVLEGMGHREQSVALADEGVGAFRLICSRALVSEQDERHWRNHLGEDANVAGAVISAMVGEVGQKAGMQIREVCSALARRSRRYSKSRIERVLAKMQEVGLAIRLPAGGFRPTRRLARRRRIHVGRVWWFNPLGEILAAPAR